MSRRSRLLSSIGFLAVCAATPSAFAQDAADIVVRLNRTEGQVRQLSGQIEQLQFENRQLKDQLRKFQEDVEFRFQEARGGGRPAASHGTQSPEPPPPRPGAPGRRGDAFDPTTDPTAPGAPRPLGTTAPSAPIVVGSAAPPPSRMVSGDAATQGAGGLADPSVFEDGDAAPGSEPLDIHQLGRKAELAPAAPPTVTPPAAMPPRAAPSVAVPGIGDPRADYEAAYAYLLQKQYEQAEMGFRQFIQAHPRDRLIPDATFWLGESYLARSRPREAAEQYLKISTDFSRASKAPDAMLKLGVALQALGARDQACATFAELERKYPQAGTSVRQGVEREQKRARCTG